LTNAQQVVDKPWRDRPVSFVQLSGDADDYRHLVDDIVEMLADIMVSYPGDGTKDMLAMMIARYVTTISSKEIPGQ
jgi:hypothetical protein